MNWFQRLMIGLPAVLFPAAAFAQSGDGDWMWGHPWGWGGMMFGGGWLGPLFWGVVIVLLVVLVARGFGSAGRSGEVTRSSAMDILRERFARGEIDKEEFEERRKTLGG